MAESDLKETLLQELISGTKEGVLPWKETSTWGTFQVVFGKNRFSVLLRSERAGVNAPRRLRLDLIDPQGAEVEQMGVLDPGAAAPVNTERKLLRELYDLVSSKFSTTAAVADEAISSLRQLRQSGHKE